MTSPALLEEGQEEGPAATTEELYRSLCAVADALTQAGVRFVLSGGTLLGAVREGDLIAGDNDWDLDARIDEIPKILGLRESLQAVGIHMRYPVPGTMLDMRPGSSEGATLEVPQRMLVKFYSAEQAHLGDIFLYELCSDGMLRRYARDSGAYVNAKMSYPVWCVESTSDVRLRDRPFPAPRDPKRMLRKVYGDLWDVPLPRHSRVQGYNHAGAAYDSDLHQLALEAMREGWRPWYPQGLPWPAPVRCTSTPMSRTWILQNDLPDPELLPPADPSGASPEEVARRMAIHQFFSVCILRERSRRNARKESERRARRWFGMLAMIQDLLCWLGLRRKITPRWAVRRYGRRSVR